VAELPHFLAVASTAIRQILLDYAKRKRAAKLGAGIGGFPSMRSRPL